jgi:hypothetical protein
MDKKIFGLIAAVSGLAPLAAAQAAPPPVNVDQALTARSFAELLEPIPNAVAVLDAVDQAQPPAAPADAVQLADHHHHHHHHYRRHRHHHHHHHYYNG